MGNKKILLLFLGILLIGIIPSINSVGENRYCCEKTVSGAWCQGVANPSECSTDPNLNVPVPTSCENTDYCQIGCCYDSNEGLCMPGTPERVCTDRGGIWANDAECNIPQCQLGCCTLGDQAAFTTLVGCKQLSSKYGVETNYRPDINVEIECLATATADDKGACVYEEEFQKTCQYIKQKDCDLLRTSENSVSFHLGILCSAPQLATNCEKTTRTTCVEGKDEVYFVDTCGNVANIYDKTKEQNNDYWTRAVSKDESCGAGLDNINNPDCGNCDYYYGSMCKPDGNKNICKSLGCTYNNVAYDHGETWCVSNDEPMKNFPGSEWFRFICYNGEVTVEPCDAFRQSTCISQTYEGGYTYARCSANLWRDCIAQDNKLDCENEDKRDCKWQSHDEYDNRTLMFACVPKIAPGFDFWGSTEEDEGGEADGICSIANAECTSTFEKGLLQGTWQCIHNCQCCVDGEFGGDKFEGCYGDLWADKKKNLCSALGDCGQKVNYVNARGYPNRTVIIRDGKAVTK